jgi:hypothetical protein
MKNVATSLTVQMAQKIIFGDFIHHGDIGVGTSSAFSL